MKAKDKITKALTDKGYAITELEYEPFGGNEHWGWSIAVDDEVDNFPDWDVINEYAIANDIDCDCGSGWIMCNKSKDALVLIKQLPALTGQELTA